MTTVDRSGSVGRRALWVVGSDRQSAGWSVVAGPRPNVSHRDYDLIRNRRVRDDSTAFVGSQNRCLEWRADDQSVSFKVVAAGQKDSGCVVDDVLQLLIAAGHSVWSD